MSNLTYTNKIKSYLLQNDDDIEYILPVHIGTVNNRTSLMENIKKFGNDELINILTDIVGEMKSNSFSTMGYDMVNIDNHLDKIRNIITPIINEVDFEVNDLNDDDFRSHRYDDDARFSSVEEMRQLHIVMTLASVFTFCYYISTRKEEDHVNNYHVKLIQYAPGLYNSMEYDKISRFMISHMKLKGSEIVDLGELLNVLPIEKLVYEAFTAKAVYTMTIKTIPPIASIYGVIRSSRKPDVKILLKQINRERDGSSSFLASFQTSSRFTLGDVALLIETVNNDKENFINYKLTPDEITRYNESMEIFKAHTNNVTILTPYGEEIKQNFTVPAHLFPIIDATLSKVLTIDSVNYLGLALQKVLSVAYAIIQPNNPVLATFIHCVPTIEDIKEPYKSNPLPIVMEDGMNIGINKDLLKRYNDLYFDIDGGKEIMAIAKLFDKDPHVSVLTGEYTTFYANLRNDLCRALCEILER